MVYEYDLEYIKDSGEGNTGRFYGLIMEEYPKIPAAELVYNEYEIPGRNGELVQSKGRKNNITIPVPLTQLVPIEDQREYQEYIRNIRKWLQGPGWLKFSDALDRSYRVLKIQHGTNERKTPIYGKITPSFLCLPYEYLDSGKIEYTASELTYNGYDTCHPKYIITGEKQGTIIINGYAVKINVAQNLTIDTELQITYRQDGTMSNSAITGDYEKMYLPTGDVTITASSGLDVKVVPRWGWEL